MKNYLYVAIMCGALGATAGCSDATQAKYNAMSSPHIIKQYSGGQLIGSWESTGQVQNEAQSDGYYFQDAATHKLVTVTGDVQITVK
jgi:hypothetical protein